MKRRYARQMLDPYHQMGPAWCRIRLLTQRSPWQYRAHWVWWHLRRDG